MPKKFSRRRPTSAFEQLEDRRLLSATGTAFIRGSVLHVRGTAGDDQIIVHSAENERTVVSINGNEFYFAFDDWKRLRVVSGKGADSVITEKLFPQSYTGTKLTAGHQFVLGSQNDFLIASLGRDYVDAGAGDDHISGVDGFDKIYGRSGRDIAYATSNTIFRSVETPVLVAGRDPYFVPVTSPRTGVLYSPDETAVEVPVSEETGPTVSKVIPFDWAEVTVAKPTLHRLDREAVLGMLRSAGEAANSEALSEWRNNNPTVEVGLDGIHVDLIVKPGEYDSTKELIVSLGFVPVKPFGIDEDGQLQNALMYGVDVNSMSRSINGYLPISAIPEFLTEVDRFSSISLEEKSTTVTVPKIGPFVEAVAAYLWYVDQGPDAWRSDPRLQRLQIQPDGSVGIDVSADRAVFVGADNAAFTKAHEILQQQLGEILGEGRVQNRQAFLLVYVSTQELRQLAALPEWASITFYQEQILSHRNAGAVQSQADSK